MPDSVVVRLCAVFGVLGLVVFFLAAMASYDDTRWICLPIGLGGIGVTLLSALVAGVAWALSARTDAATEKRP